MGPSGTGEMNSTGFTEGRALAGQGDHAFFIRLMTGHTYKIRDNPEAVQDFYFGTDIRKRHTDNYVLTFEKLLSEARDVDTADMISNALLYGSAVGRQYRIIKYLQGEDIADLELYV